MTNWFRVRLLARGYGQQELERIFSEMTYGCRTTILYPERACTIRCHAPSAAHTDLHIFLKLQLDSATSDIPFARIMREQISDLHGQVVARCSTEHALAYLTSLSRVVPMVCWKSGKSVEVASLLARCEHLLVWHVLLGYSYAYSSGQHCCPLLKHDPTVHKHVASLISLPALQACSAPPANHGGQRQQPKPRNAGQGARRGQNQSRVRAARPRVMLVHTHARTLKHAALLCKCASA